LFLLSVLISSALFSQKVKMDTVITGNITLIKDSRVDLLSKKMADYNEGLANRVKSERGYRLMLLNTTDRALAMQVRSSLLQQYPDEKVYMIFMSPYIKLKFGNFTDKSEAEKTRKQILASKIVTGNVYLLPEMVEVKSDKNAAEE
jgi:hypothetical protein